MSSYTKQDILNTLDKTSHYNFFLDLEHGYFYTAGSRINVYADKNRWAIVFEKSGYGNRSYQAEVELNYFGNCLINLERVGSKGQFLCNTKLFTLISTEELQKIESGFKLTSKNASTVLVRDKSLDIEHDHQKYLERGIQIQQYSNEDHLIDFPSLVRYLDETNPEVFRATNQELRTCIPTGLPLILTIDNWHHRPHASWGGEKPSSYETFQMIADVIVSKNPDEWKPKLEPNNDWRNWPDAGGL